MRNELDKETSPYLLQHRDNPVHWQTWSEDTIATARRADKPILLSVGYAACHWCHVMAHESFEDPDTAAVMNELFVNVKVDREERPDLDMIYQTALAITGQQGGWPLTMFLRASTGKTPAALPAMSRPSRSVWKASLPAIRARAFRWRPRRRLRGNSSPSMTRSMAASGTRRNSPSRPS